jgi:hypothetical protein
MSRTTPLYAVALTAGALVACSNGTSPAPGGHVTLNASTVPGPAALQSLSSDPITDGTNTLVFDQVQLVLRDIRFKRVNDDVCEGDTQSGGSNDLVVMSHDGNGNDGQEDACESVNAGPSLLDLPLGPGVDKMFSVAIDTGTFDEVRIKLHKPEDDNGDPADQAFLTAHPEFAKISIQATGTFNGAPFTFTSDLNAEQRMELVPPIEVTEAGTTVDVTLKVDLAAWFADGTGGLVDPATAGQGGANENLVRDNIRDSFHAFRDENHDGEDDHGGGND